MADQANGAAEQGPESRLYGAGFTRRLEFWCPPGEDRALNLNDAVALLDAGEVKRSPLPDWPGTHPDAVAGFQPPSEEEIDRMFGRDQAREPVLPSWAKLIAAQLKPIIRAEIRAELRKARKP